MLTFSRGASIFIAVLVIGILVSNRVEAARPFGVVFQVATADPGDTAERIQTLLDVANRHFTAAGVSFAIDEQRELPDSFAVLETIRERRQLRRFFVPRKINVFWDRSKIEGFALQIVR